MTDLEKDKILLLAHSIGKMARELQSIKGLLKEIVDTPQTERIKTTDYCDICNHKGCENCIANNLDDYCVPSNYAPNDDTPQTDCDTCRYGQDKHGYAHICNECGVGINNYTPQTEPQMDYDKGLQLFADILFDKEKSEQFLKECKAMGIEPQTERSE